MRNKFFLHSWWETEAEMEAAAKSEAYTKIKERASDYLLERISKFTLDVLDEDARPLLPAETPLVVSRLAKVTVKSGADDQMLAEYRNVTEGFTRQLPGCLRVQLFRDRVARNVYFLQTYWRDSASMRAAAENGAIKATRTNSLAYLEERMTIWEMEVIADDKKQPIFLPSAV